MKAERHVPPQDRAIQQASGVVTAAALYLVLAGLIGLFERPLEGLLIVGVGASLFAGAWVIQTHQSRLVAAALLVGAVALLADRLLHEPGLPLTAYGVMVAWVAAGAFALFATIRYHALNQGPSRPQ